MEKRKLYVGIDIGIEYVMLSYCMEGMTEPLTVSRVAGSENYQIPQYLFKREGLGQWFYGDEALKMAKTMPGTLLDHIYIKARNNEEIYLEEQRYTYRDLLALLLRKVLLLPSSLDPSVQPEWIILTTESLNRENMELFEALKEKISVPAEQITVIDYQESFYYYAMSQKQELWLHNAVLFEYGKTDVKCMQLQRNSRTVPQVVELREQNFGPLLGNRDVAFCDLIEQTIGKRLISSVYLTGEGFEGGWMEQSLQRLCGGRRVFLGQNLYAKGASYAASVLGGIREWNFAYMGVNELKLNLSIKVIDRGELAFLSLLEAGTNWYEAQGSCEVLLDDSREVEFWLQPADSKTARIETLELTDLPERPPRMTRLRIQVKATSDRDVSVCLRDLGFGELYKSTDKTWEYQMRLEEA